MSFAIAISRHQDIRARVGLPAGVQVVRDMRRVFSMGSSVRRAEERRTHNPLVERNLTWLEQSAALERASWGPLLRFIDALLKRLHGSGLRTFTDHLLD